MPRTTADIRFAQTALTTQENLDSDSAESSGVSAATQTDQKKRNVWQYVSIRAKDFINRILRTRKRLSALTANTHPWLYNNKKRAVSAKGKK